MSLINKDFSHMSGKLIKFLLLIIITKQFVISGFPIYFTSSSNVTVGEDAVFTCYNEVFLPCTWHINGQTLLHPINLNRSDILVQNRDGFNTTLTINGSIKNNGTTVWCVAAGKVNGVVQHNSSDTYVLHVSVFTILPTTQYVWINQNATFKCEVVAEAGFTIMNFTYGESIMPNIIEHGQQAIVSFNVTINSNGTSFGCIASNDKNHFIESTNVVYAYAQGSPSQVTDLTAIQQDQCSVLIQWSPPYLLPGLSIAYEVYINGKIIQDKRTTTNYTYCLTAMERVYNSSIIAYNNSVTGVANYSNIDVYCSIEIVEREVAKEKIYWIYQFILSIIYACNLPNSDVFIVQSCNVNGSVHVCHNASTEYGNVTVTNATITANMTLPDDQYYNTSIIITDSIGQQTKSIFNLTTNTYDVLPPTITNNDSTVCVQCNYINGANASGCTVSLVSSSAQYNITIFISDEYSIKCMEVVPGEFYYISIYEINSDGTIVFNSDLIDVLYLNQFPTTCTSEISLAQSSTTVTLTTVRPTDIAKPSYILYTVLVLVVVSILIVIIIIGLIMVLLYWKCKYKKKVHALTPVDDEPVIKTIIVHMQPVVSDQDQATDVINETIIDTLEPLPSTGSEANISHGDISITEYDEYVSVETQDIEESPKERLKSSISQVSMLLGLQSTTSSVVHITDDANITSPSLTTMDTYKLDFTSDTSNDTTRNSSATTTTTVSSTDDDEERPLLKSYFTKSTCTHQRLNKLSLIEETTNDENKPHPIPVGADINNLAMSEHIPTLDDKNTSTVVHITDDVNITSPSLTTADTYKPDFTSDTSNDTTRNSSATTTTCTTVSSADDDEERPLLKSYLTKSIHQQSTKLPSIIDETIKDENEPHPLKVDISIASADSNTEHTAASNDSIRFELEKFSVSDDANCCAIVNDDKDAEPYYSEVDIVSTDSNTTVYKACDSGVHVSDNTNMTVNDTTQDETKPHLIIVYQSSADELSGSSRNELAISDTPSMIDTDSPKASSSRSIDDDVQQSDTVLLTQSAQPPLKLLELVGSKLKTKWYKIGQQLGIDADTLSKISASTDAHGCLEKTLKAWEDDPADDKPYTWATIIRVLKSDAPEVAAVVEEHCSKEVPSAQVDPDVTEIVKNNSLAIPATHMSLVQENDSTGDSCHSDLV